jgi:hypothetical protein
VNWVVTAETKSFRFYMGCPQTLPGKEEYAAAFLAVALFFALAQRAATIFLPRALRSSGERDESVSLRQLLFAFEVGVGPKRDQSVVELERLFALEPGKLLQGKECRKGDSNPHALASART